MRTAPERGVFTCVVQHIPSMTWKIEQKKMAKFANGNNSIREGKMRANYEELQMAHTIMGDWAIKYQAKSEYLQTLQADM